MSGGDAATDEAAEDAETNDARTLALDVEKVLVLDVKSPLTPDPEQNAAGANAFPRWFWQCYYWFIPKWIARDLEGGLPQPRNDLLGEQPADPEMGTDEGADENYEKWLRLSLGDDYYKSL